MAQRKIVWTKTAEDSFKEILEYYLMVTGNEKLGISLTEKINKQIINVKSFTLLGKITQFSNIRVIIHPPYEIFYHISENKLIIELIWDSRRNPDDLKKLLRY